MRAFLSTSLLLISATVCFSQKVLRDSLMNVLESAEKVDSIYIDLLNDLSFEFIKSDPASSLPYINDAIQKADSIGYLSGLVRATTNKGSSFWVIGLHDQALIYYLRALSIDTQRIPKEYVRLTNNIGEVFKKKSLYDSAMKYYKEGWEMIRFIEDNKPSMVANNMAEAFLLKDNLDSAIFYFKEARKLATQANDQRGLAYSYDGLADVHYRMGILEAALQLQQDALTIRVQIEDNRAVIQSHLKLASYLFSKGNKRKGKSNIDEAEKISEKINAMDLLLEVYQAKSDFFEREKNLVAAYNTLKKYEELKDRIRKEEFASSLNNIQSALLTELSLREHQLEDQRRETLARINRGRLYFAIISFILVGIIISLLGLYQRKRRLILHQEEKDELISKLQVRNKNLEEFNSVISHNLREPLTQIIGYAKFYEKGHTDMEVGEIIQHIKKSAFRIDQTIRELSTVLNEKDPKQSDFREIPIRTFIQEAIETFRNELEQIPHTISLELDDQLTIHSYRPFLFDIFYHLFSNSLKFRCSSTELQITIRGEIKEETLLMSVIDNGIGFDSEKVGEKIFKMYQKFHPEAKGRGIGLYVAKSRIDSLGGEITVKSKPREGSTFTVKIPLS